MGTSSLLLNSNQILKTRSEAKVTYEFDQTSRPTIRPTVSVVIPTLNEAKNLPLLIPYLPMDWIDEVILVDGRSTDNTIEVAQNLLPSIKIVLETTKGKGAAMRAGYQAAQSDIIVLLDADGSNDPREIPRFVNSLMEGADFAKGSRFSPGGGTTDMPRLRKMGNYGFVIVSNLLFSLAFTDLCYGYHAFWRYCLQDLDLDQFDGFEIDTALYLQAVRKRLHIVEVPSFEGIRFYGEGKLQTFPDGYRVLKTILKEWTTHIRSQEHKPYMGFRGIIPFKAESDLQCIRLLGLFLAAGLRSQDTLISLLQLAVQQMNVASASIMIVDHQGNLVTSHVAGKNANQKHQSFGNDVFQNGLAGWVLRNRQPALVQNTLEDPRWLRRDWDQCEDCVRSAVSLPLVLNNQVMGVVTLANDGANRFTESDMVMLQKVAQVA